MGFSLAAVPAVGAEVRLSARPISTFRRGHSIPDICCTSRRTRRRFLSEKLALLASCSVASSAHPAPGMEKLAFKPEGYDFWTWRDHKIHYVEQGSGPPVVLIHGFGASAFHWR